MAGDALPASSRDPGNTCRHSLSVYAFCVLAASCLPWTLLAVQTEDGRGFVFLALLALMMVAIGPPSCLLFRIKFATPLSNRLFGFFLLAAVLVALWFWSRSTYWSPRRHLALVTVWVTFGAIMALLGLYMNG